MAELHTNFLKEFSFVFFCMLEFLQTKQACQQSLDESWPSTNY